MPRELACRSQRKASSLYRGVVRRNRPRSGRPYYWEASIERSGKQRALGCYFDEEAAACAYDNAARKMGYMRFNFPRHSEIQQEKHGSAACSRWYGDALKQAEQTVRERVSAGLPTSVFRGVSWQAHSQRPGHSGIWAAKIRCPTTNKLLCLGSFVDEHAAAQAFDKAARRLRGHRAIVNFPNNQHETKMSHDKGSRCNQAAATAAAVQIQSQQHGGEEQPDDDDDEVAAAAAAAAAKRLRERIKAKGAELRAARAAGQDMRDLLQELYLLQAEAEAARPSSSYTAEETARAFDNEARETDAAQCDDGSSATETDPRQQEKDSIPKLRREGWTPEEDAKLLALVKTEGARNWQKRASDLGTGRTANACQVRRPC